MKYLLKVKSVNSEHKIQSVNLKKIKVAKLKMALGAFGNLLLITTIFKKIFSNKPSQNNPSFS